MRNWFVWLALRLSSGSCLPTFAGSGHGCPRSDRCWALVAYGLFSLFPDRSLGGLWPALIGWFLVGAATAPPERETVSQHGRSLSRCGCLASPSMRETAILRRELKYACVNTTSMRRYNSKLS